MKICLLSEYFYPDSTGGTGTVLTQLIRHLKDSYPDLEIDVITSRHLYRSQETPSLLPAYEDWNGIRIFRVDSPLVNTSTTRRRLTANMRFTKSVLRKLMSLPRYDALLVTTAPPPLAAAAKFYKRLTGKPYAYLIYDLYPDIAMAVNVLRRQSRVAAIIRRQQKAWLHSAAKVIVLGRCMADYLNRHYAISADRIQVIPVGADTERVTPLEKDTRFRAAQNLEGFVVLWAGNFGWHQNFDAILDAAKILRDQEPAMQFVFVGDGMRRQYIAERIANEEITNVQMFPFVADDDFSDMLASADVSLVALEAGAEGLGVPSKFYNIMASGRPTVAIVARDSEVAQVLEEVGCGIRVNHSDVAGLVEALSTLHASPDTAARMGAAARRACVAKYSIACIEKQFYETLQTLSQVHPAPDKNLSQNCANSPLDPVANEGVT